MILFASGRTDICAYYSEWFFNRYKEGFVDTRNPFFERNILRIYFSDVDLILFCTKNPIPMLKYIEKIDKKMIFQITITPYGKDIEGGLKNSKKEIIEAVKALSKKLGKERVEIRYDPILVNKKYNFDFHVKAFSKLAKELSPFVRRFIISFIGMYKNVLNNINDLKLIPITIEDENRFITKFNEIAEEFNTYISLCNEVNENLFLSRILEEGCLSKNRALELTGKNYSKQTARKNVVCDCVKMTDIGYYNSCLNFCKYCYANFDEKAVEKNVEKHNPNSSLLIGEIDKQDTIKIKKE